MKNHIVIERPDNAVYPREMILMEKNILASILCHEAGKKFILPIFKAFFPQIKNNDELFIDTDLSKLPLSRRGLDDFDGIIAHRKNGDYFVLNVHSPKQCQPPVDAQFEVLTCLRLALIRAGKFKGSTAPNFYYLGLMPNMDFRQLPDGANAEYQIGETDKEDQAQIIEVVHFRLEAMKSREIPCFEQIEWDTKWAFLLGKFGADDFHVPDNKGNRYFKEFLDTILLKVRPIGTIRQQRPNLNEPNNVGYASFTKRGKKGEIDLLFEETERYIMSGKNHGDRKDTENRLGKRHASPGDGQLF